MKLAIVVVLAVVAAALARPHGERVGANSTQMSWEEFKAKFSKVYATPAEEVKRAEIFAKNVVHIESHNAKGLSYTLAVNEFADMTHEEFKGKYVGTKVDMTRARNEVTLPEPKLAASVDWRSKNAVTPIKNQGQCGSCWSFSTTGSVEGIWAITKGQLVSLSEQQLVDCSGAYGNQGCNGGLMDDAFQYIIANKGLDTESDYPYTAQDGNCDSTKQSTHAATITGYADVPANNEAQMIAAVNMQPVSVAIEADQSDFQFYSSGIFTGPCGTQLDHGVLAVGYNTDGATGYWIVKNSWGTSWGDQGYIYMAQGQGASGICGINMMSSYPTLAAEAKAPANGHYGDPNSAPCQSDEIDVEIEGVDGVFCSPDCSSTSPCPTDVPDGATARPQCILETAGSSSPTNCALVCDPTQNRADGTNDQCPTNASCKAVSIIGVCTYDS